MRWVTSTSTCQQVKRLAATSMMILLCMIKLRFTWTTTAWALHPYSSGGAYLNFIMDEGQERVQASYKDNYNRLADIKAKYDSGNFFSVNQNIKPAK